MHIHISFRVLGCMKQDMTVETIMENLRNEILKTLEAKNITYLEFSLMCDISYENLCKIISGKNHDIKLSTLLKICSEAGISYEKILLLQDIPESININGMNYVLVK